MYEILDAFLLFDWVEVFIDFIIMNEYVSRMWQSLHICIKNISRICDLLDIDIVKLLIGSIDTSRLDYCSSFLQGSPKSCLDRLQKKQNKAVKTVTVTKSKTRGHDCVPFVKAVT